MLCPKSFGVRTWDTTLRALELIRASPLLSILVLLHKKLPQNLASYNSTYLLSYGICGSRIQSLAGFSASWSLIRLKSRCQLSVCSLILSFNWGSGSKVTLWLLTEFSPSGSFELRVSVSHCPFATGHPKCLALRASPT